MSLEIWITYLIASIILSVSPGAGAVNTMANGMSYGFRYTMVSILGLQTGLAIHVVLVGLGLGALVAQSATAFTLIKWAGVAYLIYLGYKKFTEVGVMNISEVNQPMVPPVTLYRRAVMVNLTNPKSIVFLVALFPQFLNPDAPQAIQILILGTTSIIVDVFVMIGYATLATRLSHFIKSERHMKIQNRIFGGMFMGAGSLLAGASRS